MIPSLVEMRRAIDQGLRRTIADTAPTVVKENRAAARVPASRVPSIAGVHLLPLDAEATLIDISAHGVAVECGRRLQPKSEVTVLFDGTFDPASVEGRVARCAVAGIGHDGELQYQVGIAFTHPIELREAPTPMRRPEALPAAPAATPANAVRNRW